MPDVTAIERKLAEAQRVFFSAADSVAAQQWNVKPAAESWSAVEVVAHLMKVERAVTIGAERTTLHRPQKIPSTSAFTHHCG